MDKDIFIKSDIFEDFNRETNQTVKNLDKGIDNASNGIDTILGTIQDFIIENSQLLFGSLVVLCIAFLAMICCCLCPSSCCAFSVLKSICCCQRTSCCVGNEERNSRAPQHYSNKPVQRQSSQKYEEVWQIR